MICMRLEVVRRLQSEQQSRRLEETRLRNMQATISPFRKYGEFAVPSLDWVEPSDKICCEVVNRYLAWQVDSDYPFGSCRFTRLAMSRRIVTVVCFWIASLLALAGTPAQGSPSQSATPLGMARMNGLGLRVATTV